MYIIITKCFGNLYYTLNITAHISAVRKRSQTGMGKRAPSPSLFYIIKYSDKLYTFKHTKTFFNTTKPTVKYIIYACP